jgi:arylsulfatase A-like enzyme
MRQADAESAKRRIVTAARRSRFEPDKEHHAMHVASRFPRALCAWLLMVGFGCSVVPLAQTAEAAAAKPNVVIIFADDLGYGDLACFGHPTIATPHLDQMAREGQKWSQFYAAAPICTPSRASLLTGRVPPRTGVKPGVYFSHHDHGLPEREITIAERLKTAGYATSHVGKWHLGHTEDHRPTDHGFDHYFGVPYSNDMRVDPKMPVAKDVNFRNGMTLDKMRQKENKKKNWVPLMRDEKVIEYPAKQSTLTRRYTKEATRFIQKHQDEPFFLYFAHTFPHVPLRTTEPWKGKSRRGLYGDVVEEIDHSVGQVLQTLRDTDQAKDTLVVFTSDNGPWLRFKTRGGSAGLLRGGKMTTWEGGVREPTLFWWPGQVDPGVVREMGSTLDLMPTLCDIVGIEPPTDRILDGQSLKPALFGTGPSPRKTMFYYNGHRQLRAVRKGPWKLRLAKDRKLFHLGHDPEEEHNIAGRHADIVQALKRLVDQHKQSLAKD